MHWCRDLVQIVFIPLTNISLPFSSPRKMWAVPTRGLKVLLQTNSLFPVLLSGTFTCGGIFHHEICCFSSHCLPNYSHHTQHNILACDLIFYIVAIANRPQILSVLTQIFQLNNTLTWADESCTKPIQYVRIFRAVHKQMLVVDRQQWSGLNRFLSPTYRPFAHLMLP